MSQLDDIRIVLLQARTAEEIILQEQTCFLERCRVQPEQILPVSVLHSGLSPALLDGTDALMIGGAGEFSATQDYEWMDDVLHVVRAAYDRDVPTFGSCWGHQIIARALGGEVVHDSDLAELGCHSVELTPAGTADPLFGAFPRRFLANMGHHDRVTKLPEGAVELAVSDTQGNQAFRVLDKPMYGTQFHSELDARRERERLYRYRAHYPEIAADETFQAILDSLAETTEVDHLLHDFLLKIVLKQPA